MNDRRSLRQLVSSASKKLSELDSTDINKLYQYEQSNRSQKLANIKKAGIDK